MIQTVTLRYTRGFGYVSIYMRAWIYEIIRTGDLNKRLLGDKLLMLVA